MPGHADLCWREANAASGRNPCRCGERVKRVLNMATAVSGAKVAGQIIALGWDAIAQVVLGATVIPTSDPLPIPSPE